MREIDNNYDMLVGVLMLRKKIKWKKGNIWECYFIFYERFFREGSF